jgi:glycogen(starch) synthase
LEQWKAEFFDSAHIGVPNNDLESNDAIIFGFLVTWFLGEVWKILLKILKKGTNF